MEMRYRLIMFRVYFILLLLKFRVISTDMPEKQCGFLCAENDPTALEVERPKSDLLSMYQMYNFSDMRLEEFCQSMNATNECYQNCQPVHSKYAFSKLYDAAQFICQKTNFMTYLPCYATVIQIALNYCFQPDISGNCINERQNFDKYKVGFNVIDSINAFCKYLKCVYQCRRPLLLVECGSKADDEMKTFFNVVWEMQTKYYYDNIVMTEYVTCSVD